MAWEIRAQPIDEGISNSLVVPRGGSNTPVQIQDALQPVNRLYAVAAPTTGQTVTMAQYQNILAVNPAGTLAALTVKLPPSPVDGQEVQIGFSQAITALTVQDSAGGANVVGAGNPAANSGMTFVFQTSAAKWFRCG